MPTLSLPLEYSVLLPDVVLDFLEYLVSVLLINFVRVPEAQDASVLLLNMKFQVCLVLFHAIFYILIFLGVPVA